MNTPKPSTRRMALGVVLTITTGRLLCEMEELHDALDFITDSALMTHELPAAADVCGKWLVLEHPALRSMPEPPAALDGREVVSSWLAEVANLFGLDDIEVTPLPSEAEWKRRGLPDDAASIVVALALDEDGAEA